MNEKRAVHVIISGKVQGVFFRMETLRTAGQYRISGWVMNRSDGTVEALFEGDTENVDAILEWCHKGPPSAVVRNLEIEEKPYTGQYSDFMIRYSYSA